ncbi:hypothetical protein CLOLEP_02698 [[Clostridium] leptum DSM 753]|uniref:Uncharacterized protein n=1 Tax=[Clostridium] leptum DSM 753 TaxID=428125 RepID=A7VVT4_9FIRM|nr:hypothetical protein CLOLEP_02698 [[Clostridium] leptum DSM 753]
MQSSAKTIGYFKPSNRKMQVFLVFPAFSTFFTKERAGRRLPLY